MSKGRGVAALFVLSLPIATALVVKWEGVSNAVYLDGGNVPTVCYGHTGPDVQMGQPLRSDDECKALLDKDLKRHGPDGIGRCMTNEAMPVPLVGGFWSWAVNVGVGSACGSTAMRLANAGDYVGACVQLSRWTYDNGVHIKGLANRRADERRVCQSYAT